MISVERAGPYVVTDETYKLTTYANDTLGLDRSDDSGTWDRKGNRIVLESDQTGLITLRKIEDEE